jgi:hypothetical protein
MSVVALPIHCGLKSGVVPGPKRATDGSQFVDHFVGAFFLD